MKIIDLTNYSTNLILNKKSLQIDDINIDLTNELEYIIKLKIRPFSSNMVFIFNYYVLFFEITVYQGMESYIIRCKINEAKKIVSILRNVVRIGIDWKDLINDKYFTVLESNERIYFVGIEEIEYAVDWEFSKMAGDVKLELLLKSGDTRFFDFSSLTFGDLYAKKIVSQYNTFYNNPNNVIKHKIPGNVVIPYLLEVLAIIVLAFQFESDIFIWIIVPFNIQIFILIYIFQYNKVRMTKYLDFLAENENKPQTVFEKIYKFLVFQILVCIFFFILKIYVT